jgi:hypothetical protein
MELKLVLTVFQFLEVNTRMRRATASTVLIFLL